MLSNTHPHLLGEWDYMMNEVKPEEVSAGSNKRVWWKCKRGHQWLAVIGSRTGKKPTGCPYCARKKVMAGETDLATTHPYLLAEWDYEKNEVTPEEVLAGTSKKVWWKCSEGHRWVACVSDRTGKKPTGCPYCAGQRVIVGKTDLATTHPDLLDEWNYERNKLKPDEVSAGSDKKVWWKCKRGHQWMAAIGARTGLETDCPYCSGRRTMAGETDLATTHPYLLAEWDYEKNEVKPDEVSAGSNKRVWWKCSEGHRWVACVSDRTGKKPTGCPYCAGQRVIVGKTDLATTHPDLLDEWNYERNKLKPDEVSAGSDKKVWWKCKRGHQWTVAIKNRTGCPFCAGKRVIVGETDLATTHPYLLAEWNYEKNKLKPEEVSAGSGKKVWWKCKQGHQWTSKIVNRIGQETSCPYCSGRKAIVGETDLATTHPYLLAEWNYEKNEVKPEEVSAGSGKRVWWKCKRGHQWSTRISVRTWQESGCPYCSGRKAIVGETDLATTHPYLLAEWNYEKNKLKPEEVSAGSGKKVWWKCKQNKEHEWRAAICTRTWFGCGCPTCAKSN